MSKVSLKYTFDDELLLFVITICIFTYTVLGEQWKIH